MNKFLIIYLGFSCFNQIYSQKTDSPKNFQLYSPETLVYFFGEKHDENTNQKFYVDVINYFISVDTSKTIKVFIEYPFIFKDVFQSYTKSECDSETNTAKSIINQFPDRDLIELLSLLNYIREINQRELTHSQKVKIEVVPFDPFAFYNFQKSFDLIKIIYPKILEIRELNKFFLLDEKTLKNIKKMNLILAELLIELYNSQEFENSFSEEEQDDIINSFKHLHLQTEIYFAHSSQREGFMTNIVLDNIESTSINIVFCGSYHAYKSISTPIFTTHYSMASQIWRHFALSSDNSSFNQINPSLIQSIELIYMKRKKIRKSICTSIKTRDENHLYYSCCDKISNSDGFDKYIIITK